MKAFKLVAAIAAAAIAANSCGILTGGQGTATQTQTPATQGLTFNNGNNAGIALLALYLQYKQDNKLDLTNPNNIVNLLTLTGNIKGLTPASETTQLVSGLIAGSNNLVNQKNSTSVVSTLANLAAINTGNIGQVASPAATAATPEATAANSILTGLFGLLK